jgi:uncharacterized protein (DUF2336 family)
MIVRQFLQWSQKAVPSQRAEAARALAQTYLYADLDEGQRREADIALTGLLDDPSPLVRRALAEAFASALDAPHHIVLALADDQSDIAAIVLARSPVLGDAELIDCAAVGDAFAQSSIALRPGLSAPVAAALAEVGAREALISLAVNAGADLPEFSMRRMVERFGEDGEMREALLARRNLPAALRSDLVAATARALSAFVTSCAWLSPERAERVAREARDKAHVLIAADAEREDNGPRRLAAHLRVSGQLTAGLILRALLSGNLSLFEATLGELSGVPAARVAGHARAPGGAGFAALYRKAKLPAALFPAFRAALAARAELGHLAGEGEPALSRPMIARVMTACANVKGGEPDKLMAVLRRLDAEAAREEARALSPQLAEAEEPELMLVESEATEATAGIGADVLDFAPGLDLRGALDEESFAPEIEGFEGLERFDPSAATVRFAGQGPAMRACDIVIDFDALERELAAA